MENVIYKKDKQKGKKESIFDEERETGEIKSATVKTYLASMNYIFLSCILVSTLLMVASRNVIDFWLKSQVAALFDYSSGSDY